MALCPGGWCLRALRLFSSCRPCCLAAADELPPLFRS